MVHFGFPLFQIPYSRTQQDAACDTLPACGVEQGNDVLVSIGCPHIAWLGVAFPTQQYPTYAAFPKPNWTKQPAKVNVGRCKNIGWKGVQGKRFWQGCNGFRDPDCANDSSVTCQVDDGNGGTMPQTTPYRSYKTLSSQVRYLSCTYHLARSGQNYDYTKGIIKFSHSVDGTNTVGPLSGAKTMGVHETKTVSGDGHVYSYVDGLEYYDGVLVTGLNIGTLDSDFVFLQSNASRFDLTPPDCNFQNADTSYPAGSDPENSDYWEAGYDNKDLTNLVYSGSHHSHHATEGNIYSDDWSFTVTLSDPITAATVYADVDALLEFWRLDNDLQYPWRTDTNMTMVPLVCRNEAGSSTPVGYVALKSLDDNNNIVTYVDPSIQFTGEIWGKPLDPKVDFGLRQDVVLNGGYFAPQMVTRRLVSCDQGQTPAQWKIFAAGVFNIGQGGIPTTATMWTDEMEVAVYSFAGAWSSCAMYVPQGNQFAGDGSLRRQKYAEIKLEWNSYDFNQPYGVNKFTLNPLKSYCFAGEAGDLISAWKCNSAAPATNDVVLLNTPNHKGVFRVGAVTDGATVIGTADGNGVTFAVNAQVSALPAGTLDGACGVLQFSARLGADFNAVAPFGLLNCKAVFAAGLSTITITQDFNYWLPVDDVSGQPTMLVDAYEYVVNSSGIRVPANVPFAAGVLITKMDATHATAATDLSRAFFLCPSGKQPWWYDDGMKGDCVRLEWTLDKRTGLEAARLTGLNCGNNFSNTPFTDGDGQIHNADGTPNYGYYTFTEQAFKLKFTPCVPAVMCYSNNGEAWENGVTFPIPNTAIDQTYGSFWQAEFVQAVQSPIWVAPPLSPWSCNDPYDPTAYQFKGDDGSCLPDAAPVYYHAHPSLVEPFLALPATNQTTAPDPLAFGLWWHILSPVLNDPSGAYNNGTVWLPPGQGGGLMPWQFFAAACATIQNGCGGHADGEDFAVIYKTFVNCQP